MAKTLLGAEAAQLLNKGVGYIEAMSGSVAFDYLTAGPESDVQINPANPRRIQICLSPNSEDTQQLDLVRMVGVVGAPELAAQLNNPTVSLDVPIIVEDDGKVIGATVHSLGLYETVFTTDDGVDVSLVTIGNAMTTTERRHQDTQTPDQIRRFASFIGETALDINKVNIYLKDPSAAKFHAFALCKSAAALKKTTQKIDPKVFDTWVTADGYGDPDGITAKTEVQGVSWEVSVYPES